MSDYARKPKRKYCAFCKDHVEYIDYKDVKGGGQLTYKTQDASLVAALHKWFDAQLSDHGKDAMEGHAHHDIKKPTKP